MHAWEAAGESQVQYTLGLTLSSTRPVKWLQITRQLKFGQVCYTLKLRVSSKRSPKYLQFHPGYLKLALPVCEENKGEMEKEWESWVGEEGH
jgi:hypothetical protein